MLEKFLIYIVVRFGLMFIALSLSTVLELKGPFWFLFPLIVFLLTSGWIQFIAIDLLKSSRIKGSALLLISFIIEFFVSYYTLNGVQEIAPHFIYPGIGILALLCCYKKSFLIA